LILLFGAGGQLGRELSAMTAAAEMPLAGLGHGDADIADRSAVRRAVDRVRPQLVVNAAAYNAVDRAEGEIEEAMRVNALGPGILAEACAAARIPLIHVSTDYVFDGNKGEPYVESDAVGPLSAYARSKWEGEEAVRGALRDHIIIRTAWLYGAYGANFLKTVLRLAGERETMEMVADQTGSPTSTEDLAGGILAVAQALAGGEKPWGTYHLAGEGAATRYDFATAIVDAQARFSGRRPRVNPVASAQFPTPARRPRYSALDSSRFAARFGFRARPWRDSVARTVTVLLGKGEAA
jgi:dTDP-4-dehydrorhamnose reductase